MKKIAFIGVAITMLLLTGCKKATVTEKPKEYSVLTVGINNVTTVNKYPATIKGRQDIEIYPQVTGRIMKVCVTEGQHVRKGQTLFIIDQVPYRDALLTAQANLRTAEAQVANARLTYEGKKQLLNNHVTSQFEVQKALNSLNTAEAAVGQAAAQVTEARNNLSYTVVTSPCDGVTGTLPYRTGTLVSSTMTSPLTTVSDNSIMYVYFSIPENSLLSLTREYGSVDNAIKAMPVARLFLNDGSEYSERGHIETISGVVDAGTGSVSLRAVFHNKGGLLHSGGAGNVGLEEQTTALTIPQSATYELQDKIYAYKYVNGRAVSTQIKADAIDDQKIYIVRSGLKSGDVIVADGVSMLKDGQEIKVKK